MSEEYQYIDFEPLGTARCVVINRDIRAEQSVIELGAEILRMTEQENCPRVILDFADTTPQCLFSVFLAKLVSLQRKLDAAGGGLRLCNCNEQIKDVFRVCCLDRVFAFHDDRQSALEGWEE